MISTLGKMCKCCQSCLESLYWNCCEERFCYDESIAKYSEDGWEDGKCYTNHTGSVESLEPITRQPNNNNHLPLGTHREILAELPILAPDIYKVFSNSMIFKDDVKVKKVDEDTSQNVRPKSEYNGHIGKVVTFKTDDDKKEEDEKLEEDIKFSDFEIMFQDELFKIDEEEEDDNAPKSPVSQDEGIVMKSSVIGDGPEKISDVPSSLPSSPEQKSEKPIDMPIINKHLTRVDSTVSITRTNSAKCLLKPKAPLLPRTDSVKSFTRSNSRQEIMIKRVNSMNLENKNLKNVLSRLPEKSASFLSIDDLINKQEDKKVRETGVYTISTSDLDAEHTGENSQISKMPDTPVIKGAKFPKFFVETPVIAEYKPDTSLQSILKSPDVIFTESDFSMPRYYGRAKTIAPVFIDDSQASKSLPDLYDPGNEKTTKRLNKLGSRLKPLIIKKQGDENLRHSQQNI